MAIDESKSPEPKKPWQKGGPTPNATGRRGKKKKRASQDPIGKALDARVTLPVGGHRKKFSKAELGGINFANQLAKGDSDAMKTYLSYLRLEQQRKKSEAQYAAAENFVLAEDDIKTVNIMVARIRELKA